MNYVSTSLTKVSTVVQIAPEIHCLHSNMYKRTLFYFFRDPVSMSRVTHLLIDMQAIFRSPEQKILSGTEEIELLSPARFDVLLRVVLTILAAALLLTPVVILFKNQPTSPSQLQQKGKLQILTVFFFTLAFSASCSIFTKARRQEVFTATAAYCAVLVVFLGNTSNVTATAG